MAFPFVKRAKGQRNDKRLLPVFCFERDGNAVDADTKNVIGTVAVHETFDGFNSYGLPQKFERVEVKLSNGTRVPAYRVQSADKGYCICQDTSYKAAI